MGKSFLESAGTLVRNIGKHAKRIWIRKESPADAWAGVQKDARKLKKIIVEKKNQTADEKESVHLVSEGRLAYNDHDYEKAEAFFRQALVADATNCTAQTYLGHALYKQGRTGEAKFAWEKAVDIAPTMAAGEKARQKLLMLKGKVSNAIQSLEERVRDD